MICLVMLQRYPTKVSYNWNIVLEDIDGLEVGIDMIDSNEFRDLKIEVEKLSNTNFEKIKTLAMHILMHHSKDIRVFNFLLMAISYLSPLSEINNIIDTYSAFLKKFAIKLYPQKEKARMSAMEWINNKRIVHFINEKIKSSTTQEYNDYKLALQQLSATIVAVFKISLVVDNLASELPQAQDPVPVARTIAPKITPTADIAKRMITSRDEVDALVNRIIQYFQNNQQKLYVAAFSRALKWSALNPAVDQNNITHLAAPSLTDKKELQNALLTQDALTIYATCEMQFLRLGGHVNFDLQYHAVQAAKTLNELKLVHYLENAFVEILLRLPNILCVYYSNNTTSSSTKSNCTVALQ